MPERKKALISGITGQDGSYLAELLSIKGYEVHGIIRRSSTPNTQRIEGLYRDLNEYPDWPMQLHYGDLTDSGSLTGLVAKIRPDEIYNLAAQSHVKISFMQPEYTANVNALGCLRFLEAIRSAGLIDTTRFYQAGTSELFGLVNETPQRETTPFHPRSPYAAAKLFAHWATVNYREAYGMFACNGILFNHESPRRGINFVTKKIVDTLVRIVIFGQETLVLGNLNALRDWGHARDYVQMQWLMLQQKKPDDYVIATGQQYSVRQFVEKVSERLGIEIEWRGSGLQEEGVVVKTGVGLKVKPGQTIVRVHEKYFRPAEVETLLGDPSRARSELGWSPTTSFEDLVQEMIDDAFLAYEHKN